MGLRNIFDSIKKKNELVKEYENDDRARYKVEEKKLSSNERALNRILKEKREQSIKKELDIYNKKEQDDFWHKDIITQPYIFKTKSSNLIGGSKI